MTYVPSHVQIETVNRFCDARCPMCTIKFVPEHKKITKDEFSNNGMSRAAEIMTLETFKAIVIKFKPYVERIEGLNLILNTNQKNIECGCFGSRTEQIAKRTVRAVRRGEAGRYLVPKDRKYIEFSRFCSQNTAFRIRFRP